MRILPRFSFRYALRHPWQFGLSLLGVAMGVAVVVAVDLSNESARRAFTLSTEAVMGKSTHRISGGTPGLDEDLYVRLRKEQRIRDAAPVVEGYVAVPQHEGRLFTLLGIDPFAEAPFRDYLETPGGEADDRVVRRLELLLTRPGGVLLSAPTAEELGVSTGDEIRLESSGRLHRATIIGLIRPGDRLSQQALADLLIADIATAQELLDMVGRLSRIDLILPSETGAQADAVQRIRGQLPPGLKLESAGSRSDVTEQMTRAFNLNLTMLGLLALVVGTFLIYNTMTFSVIQRRSLMGALRALGVTRAEIFRLILLEACVVGLAATLVGLGLGVALAQGLVRLVTQTINDLYFVVTVRELALVPGVFVKGILMGLGASVFAAVVPAVEATRIPPRAAMNRSLIETRTRSAVPWAALAGVGALTLSAILLAMAGRGLGAGFAALFGIVAGFALLAPAAIVALVGLIKSGLALTARPIGPMAARGVTANLSRTAVAITALMVALATTVGVGVMVDSFRRNVAQWLEVTLQADIYVSLPRPSNRSTLNPGLVAGLSQVPGVLDVSRGRRWQAESSTGPVSVGVLQLVKRGHAGFLFVEGEPAAALRAFEDEGAVLVTEPYAYRHGVRLGERVPLMTDKGWRDFSVAGVIRDYGADRGALLISRTTFDRFWHAPGDTGLGLYTAPDADLGELIANLRREAAPYDEVIIRSNRDLRDASLEVFDRTFTVTVVLRVLAIVVALIGILSALMALQLERAKEMAVLRAQGMTAVQVWGLVETQTGVMGLIAGVLALPLGLVLAVVLILVINRRSFGWSLDVHIDPAILGQTVLLAVAAALIAGIYPALRMARTMPATALREE